MRKRKNGEGSWGEKKVKGVVYKYYRDVNGVYTYGKTDTEVKKKIQNKKNAQKKKSKEITTFGEYILNWLDSLQTSIEESTFISYEDAIYSRLINFRNYDLANVELSDLKPEMFQEYLNSLSKFYALASIQKTWGLIKRCVAIGEIKNDINPMHLQLTVKTPSESKVAHKKKTIAVPSIEDIELLTNEINRKDSNGNNWYGNAAKVTLLIMYTGMRVSEACALKWENVNLDKRELYVKESFAKSRNKIGDSNKYTYENRIKSTKTKNSIRTIPLPDSAIEVLNFFKKYYKSDEEFVYINDKNGNHYTSRQIERTMERIVKNSKCSTKTYTPHSLRHGYGSILLSKGVDIKIVSELLGHKDVSFTYNVYISIFEKDKHNAVQVLNKLQEEVYIMKLTILRIEKKISKLSIGQWINY